MYRFGFARSLPGSGKALRLRIHSVKVGKAGQYIQNLAAWLASAVPCVKEASSFSIRGSSIGCHESFS